MISLPLKVLCESAGRPFGNPFRVRAVSIEAVNDHIREIGTGLSIKIDDDMAYSIKPLIGGIYILGHRINQETGELIILIFSSGWDISQGDVIAKEFASVNIVEQSSKPIRFVENRDGLRIIVGGPERVTDDG